MRDTAVIRLIGDELYWYPSGRSEEPRRLDDESELEQVNALLSARRSAVVFAVPAADVRLQELTVTAAERRHIVKSLPYMLEDEFASDVDLMHFASRFRDKLTLSVAACDLQAMEHWTTLLEAVSGLSVWVPEPLLLPWQQAELCVLIESSQVLVRYGAGQGFAVERDMATAWLQALDIEELETVIVYGQDQEADLALLPEQLAESAQWRTGGFAEALLLGEESQPLNLLQGRFGATLPLSRWWREWRVAASLLAAAFLFQVGSSYAEYRSLETDNQTLRQQMQDSYRSAVPRGAISDPEKQLRSRLNRLRGGAEGPGFTPLLEQVGAVVSAHQGAVLSSVNFTAKVGDVRVVLVAPDFATVEAIRGQLDAAGLKADLENSNTQGDAVRARLKVGER